MKFNFQQSRLLTKRILISSEIRQGNREGKFSLNLHYTALNIQAGVNNFIDLVLKYSMLFILYNFRIVHFVRYKIFTNIHFILRYVSVISPSTKILIYKMEK